MQMPQRFQNVLSGSYPSDCLPAMRVPLPPTHRWPRECLTELVATNAERAVLQVDQQAGSRQESIDRPDDRPRTPFSPLHVYLTLSSCGGVGNEQMETPL